MPETRHSVCALDCPDACSLLINVENGAGTRLRGNPAHPVTRGFLCGKVARYLDREYSPERLLLSAAARRRERRRPFRTHLAGTQHSMKSPVSCSNIARECGPESILPYSYAGTMGYLKGSGMDRRFFHRLGASRLDRTICSSAGHCWIERGAGHPLRDGARTVPRIRN